MGLRIISVKHRGLLTEFWSEPLCSHDPNLWAWLKLGQQGLVRRRCYYVLRLLLVLVIREALGELHPAYDPEFELKRIMGSRGARKQRANWKRDEAAMLQELATAVDAVMRPAASSSASGGLPPAGGVSGSAASSSAPGGLPPSHIFGLLDLDL